MAEESHDDVPEASAITRLFAQSSGRVTSDELLPLVYQELRTLARARVHRLKPGQTVSATDLVHEAWLKVAAGGDPGWENRGHFFGAAANAMREILIDQARRRTAQKRDVSRRDPLPTDMPELRAAVGIAELLTLNDALTELEREHPRPAQVVSMRFFGGMSMPDIARVMSLSLPTVERDWRFARAALQQRIGTDLETDAAD